MDEKQQFDGFRTVTAAPKHSQETLSIVQGTVILVHC